MPHLVVLLALALLLPAGFEAQAREPTEQEQFMVELINRARGNPAAEVALLGTGSLNEGPPTLGGEAYVLAAPTDGEHVIFNTAEGRIKPKNMRRDARVAVAVYNQEMPYQQAMIRGRVVAMEHDGADAHIDQMAKKYMGLDEYPYRQPGEQRVIVKIAVDKVGLMDAG